MTKNPVVNALLGLLYIVLVVLMVFNMPLLFGTVEKSILIPIAFLSLFVFSAACMSYIFMYEPLQLFLDGHKKESVNLFLTTIATFAISAIALVAIGLYLTHRV